MAISFSTLTKGSSTSYDATTASISPSYTPVIVVVSVASNASTSTVNSISGCSLTWTLVDEQSYASRRRLMVWRGDGTPSSGTLTIDGSGGPSQQGIAWIVFESPDIDDFGTPVSASGAGGTTASWNIGGTPVSGDASFACIGIEDNNDASFGGGFTQLDEQAETGNVRRIEAGWASDNDQAGGASWTGTCGWASIAFDVQAAASGITQAIGLNTETDTAQSMTSAKAKALGLNTETDSALSMSASQVHGFKAFGEENPTGEDAVSWATWSDGAGGSPTIDGDADWGKLSLSELGEEGRSIVYNLHSLETRTYTLSENEYGTGSGSGHKVIRGSTASFTQDSAVPVWEEYVSSISRYWQYVQVGATTYTTFDQSSGALAVEP